MKVTFIVAALFLTLQGCATAPMASSDKDVRAKSFEVSKDKSNLYIFRNENFGGAISMDVAVNGKDIGRTAAKTYFKLELIPGKYQVQSKAENVSLVDVVLNAGENTFLWQEVKMGVLYARTKLSQVDVSTGKQGVLESKLIANLIENDEIKPLGYKQDSIADPFSNLKSLKQLQDSGAITQQEYDQAKEKILKGM